MSIRRRGNSWIIDISLGLDEDGRQKRQYFTVHGTEAEAFEFEREIRKELGRERQYPGKLTVERLAEPYLEYARNNLRPRTYHHKKRDLFGHILPFFGKMVIERIPPFMIERYKTMRLEQISGIDKDGKLIEDAKPTKCATTGGRRQINLELLCLSAMSTWAADPKKGGYGIQPIRFEQLSYRRPLPTVLTQGEARAFVDAFASYHRALFYCLYKAGMRKGEVLPLRYAQIDHSLLRNEAGEVIYWGHILAFGKGGKERMVPMTKSLWTVLVAHNMSQVAARKNDLVFPSRRTGRPLTDIRKAIISAKKKAGISKRITPHTFEPFAERVERL
jgi:integrase